MAAGVFHRELKVGVAFLRGENLGNQLVALLHNATALVDLKTQLDAAALEQFGQDGAGSTRAAHDLFVVAESQVNVIIRHKTVGDQRFQSIHIRLDVALGVGRTTAPQATFCDNPFIGRVFPHGVVALGDDVLMGGQHQRQLIRFAGAFPVIQQTHFAEDLFGHGFMYQRVGLLQVFMER